MDSNTPDYHALSDDELRKCREAQEEVVNSQREVLGQEAAKLNVLDIELESRAFGATPLHPFFTDRFAEIRARIA